MTDQDIAAGVLAWLENNAHSEISLKTKMGGYFPQFMSLLRPIAAGKSVIVPIEPSQDAVQIGYETMRTENVRDSSEQGRVKRIYRAMIAASQEGEK